MPEFSEIPINLLKLDSRAHDRNRDRVRDRKGETLWERCFDALSKTTRSKVKMEARSKLLQERPEERRHIDSSKLKTIIDYESFKCHPQSSIARDEAIQGSDIDGALVVSRNEVPIEQQLAFVQELRNQGFSAAHQIEIDAFNQNKLPESVVNLDELLSMVCQKSDAENTIINFATIAEMEELTSKKFNNKVWIYVAGYSIP